MINFFTKKLGLMVSIKVNAIILIVMIAGTYVLLLKQNDNLEKELLDSGKIQSILGAKTIGTILNEAIDNGVLNVNEMYDTHYEPIGNFDPPKYHTKYDAYLDKAILGIQDEFLLDTNIIFAVAVDKNGYLPTHNTRYQQPITGDQKKDLVGNRTKRIFNDSVGIRAAINKENGFQQIYKRDTGKTMWDISSPIFVKGKQWGAFRIGMSLEAISRAQKQLMTTLIGIMGSILLLSVVMVFLVVNRALVPVIDLADRANDLAKGERLDQEIAVTRKDETGEMQASLNKLRVSILIAMKRKK
jgi:methyl-accepting chemotaxis protein